ncbi:hypothetical protein Syun_029181 [Stephania yunnanensis]|uniref:Uncharacterized protein n=1 Tax=Stephania yunnanensis TaxID=152371 RepID=A0AAP0HJ80_9MAGN
MADARAPASARAATLTDVRGDARVRAQTEESRKRKQRACPRSSAAVGKARLRRRRCSAPTPPQPLVALGSSLIEFRVSSATRGLPLDYALGPSSHGPGNLWFPFTYQRDLILSLRE